jgi:hypothetical protein
MSTHVFAQVAAVVAAAVVAEMLLELYVRTRLQRLTTAEVYGSSLPLLYLYAIVAMRARLRGARRPPPREARTGAPPRAFLRRVLSLPRRAFRVAVHTRLTLTSIAFAFIPTDTYRRVRIERMWHSTLLHLDWVIDDDLAPSRGTRRQFFDYFDTLVGAFGEPEVMDRRAMLEVVSWLYVVRGCREVLDFDPIEPMKEMWNLYAPDALRVVAEMPVTDAETLGKAHRCFVMSYWLANRILGLDEERARLGAELETPTTIAADTMRDVLRDAQAGRLSVPAEELARRGITAEAVFAHSTSWRTLALVEGLAEWLAEWAGTQRVLLEEKVLPTLRKEVFPYVRPRWRRSRMLVQAQHRLDFLRSYERQWRHRADAARG